MQFSINGMNFSRPNLGVRRHKFGMSSLIAILIMGIIFIVVSQALLKAGAVNKNWKTITGTVTTTSQTVSNGANLYAPIVLYTINNKFYTVTSSTSSSSLPKIGSTKQVAYNPQSPSQAKVVNGTGEKGLFYFMSLLGIILIILGPLLYLQAKRRTGTIANLQQTGQKRQGIIVDIKSFGTGNSYNPEFNNGNVMGLNNQTTMNYKIVVSAADGIGGTRSYISDAITGIGGLAMADFHTNPIPIDVYVDPYNPQNYYVDVSEVPTLTPERIMQLIQSVTRQQPVPQPAIQNNVFVPATPQPVAPPSPVALPTKPEMPIVQQIPTPAAYTMAPQPIAQANPMVTAVPQSSRPPAPVNTPSPVNMGPTVQNSASTNVVQQPLVAPAVSYASAQPPVVVSNPVAVPDPVYTPIAQQTAPEAAYAMPLQPLVPDGSYASTGQQSVAGLSPVGVDAARNVPIVQKNNLAPEYQMQPQSITQDSNAIPAHVNPQVIAEPSTMTMPTVTIIPSVPQDVPPANSLQQSQPEPSHVPDGNSTQLPPIAQQP